MDTRDENDRAMDGDDLPLDGTPIGDDEPPAPRLPRKIVDILPGSLERMQRRADGIEKPISTPWREVNDQLPGGGFWPGLHMLVSGTGLGKSAWALQLALHATRNEVPIAYVGLELDDDQIAMRLLGEQAGLRWSSLYNGEARLADMNKARAAAEVLRDLPFHVEPGDPMGWSANDLRSLAKAMRENYPEQTPGTRPILIVLDFLQIVGAELDPAGMPLRQDLRERIGRAAYVGRHIARDFGVVVLMISSVARDKYSQVFGDIQAAKLDTEVARGLVVERFIRRPDVLVGMGKESGEIEYAADSVTVAIKWPQTIGNESPVIFAAPKLRAGRSAWCELRFDGHRFTDSPDGGAELMRRMTDDRKPASKSKPSNGSDANGEKERLF